MSLGEKSQAATVFPIWHWTTFVRWPTYNNNSFLYVVFQQIFVESTMFKTSCFELNVWRVNLYSSSRKNTFPKDFARIGTRSSTSFWDQKVLGFWFFTDVRAHLSVRGPYAPHTPQWEPLVEGPSHNLMWIGLGQMTATDTSKLPARYWCKHKGQLKI